MGIRTPAQLTALCHSEHRPLVEMLSLYCGDRGTAEDLAQETLVRLCQHWRRVARMDNPRAWIRRVAINLAHSHFRRKRAERRARGYLEQFPQAIQETDEAGALSVRRAIAALPHRQKSVLVLRYYHDLTFAQIADTLQIPENTAKSLGRRAVLSLRNDPTPSRRFGMQSDLHELVRSAAAGPARGLDLTAIYRRGRRRAAVRGAVTVAGVGFVVAPNGSGEARAGEPLSFSSIHR